MTATDKAQIQARGFWVNDFDMTRLGFLVLNVEEHRAGLTFPDRTTALPGRVGTVALAREFESMPRRLVIMGNQLASSAAQLVEDVTALKQRCQEGTVEVRFGDNEDRVYLCRAGKVVVTPVSPALPRNGKALHAIRLEMLAQDPLIYEREGSVVGFSTAKAETPLGTAPSLPTFRVNGPTTCGWTLTYSDFRGDVQAVQTLSSTVILSGTQFATLDHELSNMRTSTGGDLVGALSSTSDDPFFALDPQDGAGGSSGPWPTVQIDSTGSAGLTGDALYRAAYL